MNMKGSPKLTFELKVIFLAVLAMFWLWSKHGFSQRIKKVKNCYLVLVFLFPVHFK